MSKVGNCHGSHHHQVHEHKEVELDGKTYDVSTKKGRDKFEAALEAKAAADGVDFDYNRKTNEVTVGGKTYDLDHKREVRAFQKDAADGLDGNVTPGYLKEIEINDQTFDISTKEGKKKFAADLKDGNLDGQSGTKDGNVLFDAETNTVLAGDRTYNLNDIHEFFDFQRDASDGKIDGKIGAPPSNTPSTPGTGGAGTTPPAGNNPSAGGSTPPQDPPPSGNPPGGNPPTPPGGGARPRVIFTKAPVDVPGGIVPFPTTGGGPFTTGVPGAGGPEKPPGGAGGPDKPNGPTAGTDEPAPSRKPPAEDPPKKPIASKDKYKNGDRF